MTNNNLIYNEECNIEYFNSEKINYGSHQMYEKNDKAFQNAPQGKFDEQCCICNKGMNTFTGKGYQTRGFASPLSLVHKKDHEHLEKNLRGSDMGAYFVGSECGKKIKSALKESGLNWKDYIYYFDNKS
tara:strand:- start:101 stop:487 length:387 start_codon:yes stop_codon:yes gene_type:complete